MNNYDQFKKDMIKMVYLTREATQKSGKQEIENMDITQVVEIICDILEEYDKRKQGSIADVL